MEVGLVPAIVLGTLPSLSNAFIVAAAGFLLELTDSACIFYKLLLCLYLMATLASWVQYRTDAYFDSKFSSREVYAFRIFVPALLISIVLIAIGELQAYAATTRVITWSVVSGILSLTAVAGFCAGALWGVGAVVTRSMGGKQIVLIWIGNSFGGMLCIAVVYAFGFNPRSSAHIVRLFFLVASVMVQIGMGVLGVFHLRGNMDAAYGNVIDEDAPLLGERMDKQQVSVLWVQGANAFMTSFCFPLLPLFCSSQLIQELVLWKLFMDFLAPCLVWLSCLRVCSFSALVFLIVLRLTAFAATLLLLNPVRTHCGNNPDCAERWWIVGSYDTLMFLGALVSCLADTCTNVGTNGNAIGRGGLQQLRKLRLASQAGLCIALVTGGALLYMMQGTVKPKRNFEAVYTATSRACSVCANPDLEHGNMQSFPCGGQSSDKMPGLWIFHYGANMGCKKLNAIGVEPQSAQAAYIPGLCLRFGDAEGVPTSSVEPAFGNLAPCRDGCVHGVLHRIPKSQLPKIDATELGYALVGLPEVIGYNGQRLLGAKAYVMHKNMTARAPSRRYGGLLHCTAKAELAAAYAQQLSCQLAEHGIRNLACSREKFMPLAAMSASPRHTSHLTMALFTVLLW